MVAHFPYGLNTEVLGEQGNFAATGDRRVLQNNRNRWDTADTNNDYDGRTVRDILPEVYVAVEVLSACS